MSDAVLITGASVGLGLELTRLLLDTDKRLVLTAREASLHRFATAGIAFRSGGEHVTEQDRLAQMAVNFRAPMALASACLPAMRARRSGRIINISSVGGMMAMPTMAVYSAS